jgi:hypothetical protein
MSDKLDEIHERTMRKLDSLPKASDLAMVILGANAALLILLALLF